MVSMHLLRRRSTVLLAVTFLVASVGRERRATAQEPAGQVDEAVVHAERARRHYETLDFPRAAEEFRLAFQIDPRGEYLYGMAQAYRMSGDCERATLSYRAYLRTGPSERARAAAEENLARCASKTDPPDTGPAQGVDAPETPPETAPTPKSAEPVAPREPPLPAPPDVAPAPPIDALGVTFLVAGAATALGGAGCLIGAGVVDPPEPFDGTYDAYASRARTATTVTVVGAVLGGVGVAASVVGVVRLATVEHAPVAVSFAAGPTGAWVRLRY